MRISLSVKLMASYLLVAALIVVPSLWLLRRSLVTSLERTEAKDLQRRAEELRDRLSTVPAADLDRSVRDFARLLQLRITYVDRAGVVLCDSDLPAERIAGMENHRERPEVMAALGGGYGYSYRMSATLGEELIYGAVPLPATGPARAVVRVAQRVSFVHRGVTDALFALRLATGAGVSAAFVLSLVAALVVSIPLRKMRDAAQAFSQARFPTVKRINTGDELEELSEALDALGQKLRVQLVEVGAQEALLVQAVRAFPSPAMALGPDLEPIELNGAFRRYAGMSAANEGELLTRLVRSPRLAAAKKLAENSGLPTELSLSSPNAEHHAHGHGNGGSNGNGASSDEGEARLALLVPLARPNAASLWLLVADLSGPESEARGTQAVHRLLRSAETVWERLWSGHPHLRSELALLHQRLDQAARAAGRPEAVGVEPVAVVGLVKRCAEEVRAVYPERAAQLVLDVDYSDCEVAESAGIAARAIRVFLADSLRAVPAGLPLTVTLTVEPTRVKLRVEGGAPSDMDAERELLRALGGDVARERGAASLSLPRA